jgi:hypothetical protein
MSKYKTRPKTPLALLGKTVAQLNIISKHKSQKYLHKSEKKLNMQAVNRKELAK